MKKAFVFAPSASDSKVELADWLELRCILDADSSSSIQDLIRELRRGGTVEAAVRGVDQGSEETERIAQDAFAEIEDRARACGGSYPFVISSHSIELQTDYPKSPYIFQLLLSRFGLLHKAGAWAPDQIFENLAACAAQCYFGPDGKSLSLAFGFPRRYEAKGFRDAVDHLCNQLGEGGGCVIPTQNVLGLAKAKKVSEQKDGKLDIVAWRPFPDGRTGKLIGFGQCATGATDWRQKMSELQPDVFLQLWLQAAFAVKPLRMFFVPRRVEEHDWHDVSIQAGLLFDRCRITHHMAHLPKDVRDQCEKWTTKVIATDIRRWTSPAQPHERERSRKRGRK